MDVDWGSFGVYYDREISGRWALWFFNLAEYNNVHKSRSNQFGAGPKLYLLKGNHILSLSAGVLYDYDHIVDEGFGRYSHRPKYSYKDWIDAVYFYQPAIEDSGDFIEKYKVSSLLPYTGRVGKIYCQKEYRSKVGTLDNECGIMATIAFGD